MGEDLRAQAFDALRDRGVDAADRVLQEADPADVLAACERWDRRRETGQDVGSGLLVHWIRNGQTEEPERIEPPSPLDARRARFDAWVAKHPEGSVLEPHANLIRDELEAGKVVYDHELEDGRPCSGSIVVSEISFPSVTIECTRATCFYRSTLMPGKAAR